MLIKRPSDIRPSEITDESLWENRRSFLRGGAAAALGITLPSIMPTELMAADAPVLPEFSTGGPYNTDEKKTPFDSVTGYNNFYEFGLDKRDPAAMAHALKPRPWTVSVTGECENPKEWDIDDLIKAFPLHERIYRLRCVEAWSMVVPWVGFEMGALIKAAKPTSKAKYVRMETLVDPKMFRGQIKGIFGSSLDWPYEEGLRIDEATHPLTIMAVGLYGKIIPNQNGAPMRLVVPWKYGFKSIKSIVKIELTEKEPATTWNKSAPREYGFYANVNPDVDHPRWSQAKERRVGSIGKQKTLPFNGYADEVASLYSDMDLKKFY